MLIPISTNKQACQISAYTHKKIYDNLKSSCLQWVFSSSLNLALSIQQAVIGPLKTTCTKKHHEISKKLPMTEAFPGINRKC